MQNDEKSSAKLRFQRMQFTINNCEPNSRGLNTHNQSRKKDFQKKTSLYKDFTSVTTNNSKNQKKIILPR